MTRALREWWAEEDLPTRLALLGIVLAGGVARIAALAAPMRYDESVSFLYFVGTPWANAITAYPFPNNHLLYTVLAKLAAPLGGGAPWALRLPAFVAGVAVIPLTFWVGRMLFGRIAALVGAALAAAETPLILYSANARGYAFVVVAYLVLLLVAASIRESGPACCRWVVFTLVAAAGLATIPIMLYPLGAVALWLTLVLLAERGLAAWRSLAALALSLTAAVALALLAYLPIIAEHGIGVLVANKFVQASSWPQFFAEFSTHVARTADAWARPYPAAAALVVGLVALVGAWWSPRVTREGVSVVLAAYVWSAGLLLVTQRVPFTRNWLWLLPVVALAAGAVVEALGSTARGRVLMPYLPAVAVGLAAAGVSWGFAADALARWHDTGTFAGAEQVAAALATQAQAGDRVLAPIPSNAPLQYYMLRAGADTSLLSTPDSVATREIIVLNTGYDQNLSWAIATGMVDTARFGPVAPALHVVDGNVYVAERRSRSR
jgi:4-amino-4-deoxy-L-arabinose transferase-like glycosyltransferase